MAEAPIQSIVLCGRGLALWMTAAALGRSLPKSLSLTVLELSGEAAYDTLYGQSLPPDIYPFHLSIGLSEPDFLLSTSSSFLFGTYYDNWAQAGRSWIQAFQQPLPVWDGVPLSKLVHGRRNTDLQALMISAQAARRGVFAHPPEDKAHPLSRAEYGYAFDAVELTALYKRLCLRRGMKGVVDTIAAIDRDGDRITKLRLADGNILAADFFIDASGPTASLRNSQLAHFQSDYEFTARSMRHETAPLTAPAQRVTSDGTGWQSEIRLRSGARQLSVSTPDIQNVSLSDAHLSSVTELTAKRGHCLSAWIGNCVAIGQAAGVIEPLTTAPIKLLLRDIDRLSHLIPLTSQMHIEAREYNRQFRDDYDHAALFHDAFFALPEHSFSRGWQTFKRDSDNQKLTRKLTQYNSRGHLVSYDNEPFDDVDWAILHDGMGRQPRRLDPLANLVKPESLDPKFHELKGQIEAVTRKMPPHPVYMEKFLSYLKRNYA